jgi:hypothetical protein
MDYSKSLLLYQDEPEYGLLFKLIIIVPLTVLLAAFIYLGRMGESAGAVALLVEFIIFIFTFWAVFPRSYQVYEDHIRIKLGGPFSVGIGFDMVKTITVTSRQTLSVNLVTRLTKSYVEIAKKKGLSIAITPRNEYAFVENANRALNQWIKTHDSINPNKPTL